VKLSHTSNLNRYPRRLKQDRIRNILRLAGKGYNLHSEKISSPYQGGYIVKKFTIKKVSGQFMTQKKNFFFSLFKQAGKSQLVKGFFIYRNIQYVLNKLLILLNWRL
jgi:hypothetical protein